MLETILAAVDASANQTAILDQTAALATAFGSQVHVVSVAAAAGEGSLPLSRLSPEYIEDLTRETREILEAACQRLSELGVICQTHALFGPVAMQVVDLAEELGADLVIIGHRRLGWLHRLVENSVGRDLLDQAPCNVLVVREGEPGS